MPNEVISQVHHMVQQEKANCTLIFQNRNQDVLPDLDDDDDDEPYVPSEPDVEAEYELPDPDDDNDNGDPDDNAGAAPLEIQGVDVENPNEEPPVIGDGAPKAPDELESPDAPILLVPMPVPLGTEHELHQLEINDKVPNLTRGWM